MIYPSNTKLLIIAAPTQKCESIESLTEESSKMYRVAFVGSGAVGKTSIISQFMSSDHSDVYENDQEAETNTSENITTRY